MAEIRDQKPEVGPSFAKASEGRQKTGLASRIREILKAQGKAVTRTMIYEALGLVSWTERQKAYTALGDFIKRGEATLTATGRIRYNHAWRRADKSPLRDKILRAMYVSNNFTNADLRRLVSAEAGEQKRIKNYTGKLIQRLLSDGYIYQSGRRSCAQGTGAERMFNVSDRVRFRIEVMR
jgi:hypothetical protein